MASYQPTILPAPRQYGFLEGFSEAFPGAMGSAASIYGEAAIKDKFEAKKKKRAEEEISKYGEAMKNGGYDVDSSTIDEEGNVKYTYKKKETPQETFSKDPQKAIKQAMLGVGTEDIGQVLNIPQPQAMSPENVSSQFPMAAMQGQQMGAAGGPLKSYGDTVKSALMDQYAPGYTLEQVNRDMMGLPLETPQEKLTLEQQQIPQSFTEDVLSLKQLSNNDTATFAAGLERLSLKYADNPEVLKRIKLMRSIFSGDEPFVPDPTLQQ